MADGYDISIVLDGQEPDFLSPTLSVGAVESASVPFTPGPDGTRYIAHVRAKKASGRTSDPVSTVPLVASSGALVLRPNEPADLRATVQAGGNVRLHWSHANGRGSPVTAFKVFGNGGGAGAIDFGTPLATVGPYDRSALVAGLGAGVIHLLCLRAYAGAVHDGNMASVVVVPRNDPPPAITGLVVTS